MGNRIFIDFDGTIPTGLGGPPREGAAEAIRALFAAGNAEIVIYSCRSNPRICGPAIPREDGRETTWAEEEMRAYLAAHDIPYHRIKAGKPYFDILIDDRTMNPNRTPWDSIARQLGVRLEEATPGMAEDAGS